MTNSRKGLASANTGREDKAEVIKYTRAVDIRGIYRGLGRDARANRELSKGREVLRGPILVMGRLYGPAGECTGKFYRYRRKFTGEPGKGLARRGEYGPGGELGRLDGRGRELYGLARRLVGGFRMRMGPGREGRPPWIGARLGRASKREGALRIQVGAIEIWKGTLRA
jgi:hypothetical protein